MIDLLRGVRDYVYPVGRLDYDSEGLLLLTNDGDLAAKLTHPRHGVARVYEARVLGVPDDHDLDRLQKGVVIDGHKTGPADVKALGPGPPARHGPRRAEPAGAEDVRRDRPSGHEPAARRDRTDSGHAG